MKDRGGAKRHYRGRRRRGARRPATLIRGALVPGPPSPPQAAPLPPAPVAGISHRQVLGDIKRIGIIGGAVLVLLLVLFLVWR